MDSPTLIRQPNSKLGVRVRMWKDVPGTLLSPVLTINNSKAALSAPEWVRKVSTRFSAIPTIFHIEVSDYGAYSLIKAGVSIGDSVVTVSDTTGWGIGTKIIFRSAATSDIFIITDVVGDTITFDGKLQNNYTTADTVEDDRWWRVATTREDATASWLTIGESVDDHPMDAAYGQYWRIGPETEYLNALTDFRLYPDTYFDISEYVSGPIEIIQNANLDTGESPLTTCTVRLLNTDDRFNRRNTSSPYIEGSVNYMRRSSRITVEWIAYGADWEVAQSGGVDDWRQRGVFNLRQVSVDRNDKSYAVLEGETLSHLKYSVNIPLLEVKLTRELIADWVLMAEHREAVTEGADNGVKHRIAVLETDELSRTNTSFQEIIGRGDFGNAEPFYSDSGEEEQETGKSAILYSGFFGIATDGEFLYTCHSMEEPEGTAERGMYIVKRFMSGVPVSAKDIFLFYESDTTDIEEGDIVFVGNIMWLHTAQQNVTKNVFKIDWSDRDNPTVSASYAAKGGAGHLPVHACTDGTYLYVLYDGGSGGGEGRVLYKVNAATYATIWSVQFTAPQNTALGNGVSGMTLIGTSSLLIFSKNPAGSGGSYTAVRYTIADTPSVTQQEIISFITKIHPAESVNNRFGWASVVQTSAGLLAMTGGSEGKRGTKGALISSPLWNIRGGAISKIATVRFFAQNGNIINNAAGYTDPLAQKEAANYDLEQVWVNGELKDETGTYSGTIKTTDDYVLNLLTGEILFLSPPRYGNSVKMNYDYKASVQYLSADNIERWQTTRELAQASNAIAYTTNKGRVAAKLRRGQEDHIFESGSGEVIQLRGRNIIHNSNVAYTFNTLQVANAQHNYFYTEGTNFTISYDSGTGIYTLNEVGSSLDGHIVITYIQGPADDALILFDGDAQLNPATILGISESWGFDKVFNNIVVDGQRSFPLDTPITFIETYAVSPKQLNIESQFSKVQRAEPNAQYDWDGDQKIFLTDEKDNINGAGFTVEFTDPLIIGTTKWVLREPDDSHVEEKSGSLPGAPSFVKVTWVAPFLEPGSAEGTTNYDVMLTNYPYWRVCTKDDENDAAWPGPAEYYKTGAYAYIKKFRDDDGSGDSDSCTIYAYATKDTPFYIDAAGIIQEAEISAATNPSRTASPDKSIYVSVTPVDERGMTLFRQAGTYDSVVISAEYAMLIGAVRIGYDGISVDVNNSASIEHFLQVTASGYPISAIEYIKVKCADMITLDGALSSVDMLGERTKNLQNPFIQSAGMARTVGYGLLDWLKAEHSEVSIQDKFNDQLDILEPCLIRSTYGNFDDETELWLVSGITYSLVNGDSGMSSTTYSLVDVVPSPSAPPAGST